MSEVTNNELMVTEEGFEEGYELTELSEETSGGNVGKTLVVVGTVAAACAAGYCLFKDKIAAIRDKAMEKRAAKRGYVIYKADEVEVVEADEVQEPEETE